MPGQSDNEGRNPGLVSFKAARLELLDENGKNVLDPRSGGHVVASGFFVRENEDSYLYTCWHVVTGIEDFLNPKIPGATQRRAKIKVQYQAADLTQPGIQKIGGLAECIVEICDMTTHPPTPLWDQDKQSVDNEELALMHVRQPFWHDVVRLKMPAEFKPSGIQLLSLGDLWTSGENAGDPVLLVGFPYGYSAMDQHPLPFVLRRSIAAVPLVGAPRRVFLDGPGAPGMSGGPVFRERDKQLFLVGIYTGVVYPERATAREGVPGHGRPETALGLICPLALLPHTGLGAA